MPLVDRETDLLYNIMCVVSNNFNVLNIIQFNDNCLNQTVNINS